MIEITTTRDAADRKAGMTVGELYAFTQYAIGQGIDPRTPVTAVMGWRQQIRTISARQASK